MWGIMIGHSAQSTAPRVTLSQDRLHQLGSRPQKAAALLSSTDAFSFKSEIFLGMGHPMGTSQFPLGWGKGWFAHISQLSWNGLGKLHWRQLALLPPSLLLASPFQPQGHSREWMSQPSPDLVACLSSGVSYLNCLLCDSCLYFLAAGKHSNQNMGRVIYKSLFFWLSDDLIAYHSSCLMHPRCFSRWSLGNMNLCETSLCYSLIG